MADETIPAPDGGNIGKNWTWHIVLNRANCHCDYSKDPYSKRFVSMECAKKLQEQSGIEFGDEECMFDSVETAVSAPFGMSQLLRATNHLLIESVEVQNYPNVAKDFMTKTLEVLGEKKFKGVKLGLGDEGDFNANMHSMEEEDWIRAVGERLKSIVLHISLADDMVSEKDTDEFTKQIHMAFPHAKVETNQELKDDPTQPEKRLL
mmetsp:Transcript_42294/g.77271  ORF Transcript_42294/g.77271 Transcript_42294/m.77271 type:complete len:206 (-) Transcript_42294:865-1482(-)